MNEEKPATLDAEDIEKLCRALIDHLEGKKAEDLLVYDVRNLATGLGDFFLLATGNSSVHLKTLYEETVDFFEAQNLTVRQEGRESLRWKLVDAGDIVVHLFTRQGREFYALERIWGGGVVMYKGDVESSTNFEVSSSL
ncbi:MAG TPA: ribosome silencing factor [Synergistaceae bacterium]|nr:ribosome silencing factor [Synergistaceae bacterium]HPJ24802.1 ribosome silencing factor [Synergistaceae bacterium]HPQ36241.1 ribosome silencing factor [Synergistaceae bacterium]